MKINLLTLTAKKYPNQIAILTKKYKINYQEYFDLALLIANKLSKIKNKKIAIYSENSLEYIILIQAIILSNKIFINLNFRNSSLQVENQLKQINTTFLFYSNLGKNISQKLSSLNKIKIINLENFISINSLIQQVRKEKKNTMGVLQNDTFVCESGLSPTLTNKTNQFHLPIIIKKNMFLNHQKPCNIIFTSGSSHIPKAVVHNYANHYYSALASHKNISFTRKDSWLLSIGLFHIGGLAIVFRALLKGGCIIISNDTIEKSIQKFLITHTSLVATQLYRLLQNKKNISRLKKLKTILLGGSAIPSQLIKKALKHKLNIFVSYGSTELSSQVCTSEINESKEKISAKILTFQNIKISNTHSTIPQEILIKSPTLCLGYMNKNKIESIIDSGGWFHSKDTGYLIKNHLFVTGRIDNMFISGGENIQPETIEKEILKIKGIKNALVISKKNKEFGRRPVVIIETEKTLSTTESTSTKKILRILKKKLSNFQVPDEIIFVESLANKNSMKIDRKYWMNKFN